MTTTSSAIGGLPAWQDPKLAIPLSDPLITGVGRALGNFHLDPVGQRRRAVLEETLQGLGGLDARTQAYGAAAENVARWKQEAAAASPPAEAAKVRVLEGDWGDVTGALTKEYGATFAALNMANAYVAGGGYVEGMAAQEENMFRRTDCHFGVSLEHFDQELDRYHADMTDLISARHGRVYLDTDTPRVRTPATCART